MQQQHIELLDTADPAANGRQLHGALLAALEQPGAPHLDYYAHNPQREDGGYLTEILDACREALATLPAYPAVAPAAREAARRIVALQSCNTDDRSPIGRRGDLTALERAPAAREAARRIVALQSCNTGDRSPIGRQGDLTALERWANAHFSSPCCSPACAAAVPR